LKRLFLFAALSTTAVSVASLAVPRVTGVHFDGLRVGDSPRPVGITLATDREASVDVLLEVDGFIRDAKTVNVRGGVAEGALTVDVPATPSVMDAVIRVRSGGRDVDVYRHRFVADVASATDEQVAALGILDENGRTIATARGLVETFAPVLRLSSPGVFGEDERFLPRPVVTSVGRSQLFARGGLTDDLVSLAFDADPLATLGHDVGRDRFLDLSGSLGEVDDADVAAALERVLPSTPTVYGTLRLSDGSLTLQYWASYLFNDWTNDHEGDWEQVTVYFGPSNRICGPFPALGVGQADDKALFPALHAS
jgi:hypothetical protein